MGLVRFDFVKNAKTGCFFGGNQVKWECSIAKETKQGDPGGTRARRQGGRGYGTGDAKQPCGNVGSDVPYRMKATKAMEETDMAKRTLKPGTLLAPVPPALITVRGAAGVNVMTAAWCGILCSDPPMTYVSVRPTRWTYAILSETREFVINLPRARDAKKVDYCGIYTGAKINKFEKCGFHEIESTVVAAPGIAECPVNLECRVTDIRPLGTHDCFIAEIVAVNADEALFDEGGKLHMERADLLAYAHGGYYGLGRRLGDFGFSARKRGHGGKPGNRSTAAKGKNRRVNGTAAQFDTAGKPAASEADSKDKPARKQPAGGKGKRGKASDSATWDAADKRGSLPTGGKGKRGGTRGDRRKTRGGEPS